MQVYTQNCNKVCCNNSYFPFLFVNHCFVFKFRWHPRFNNFIFLLQSITRCKLYISFSFFIKFHPQCLVENAYTVSSHHCHTTLPPHLQCHHPPHPPPPHHPLPHSPGQPTEVFLHAAISFKVYKKDKLIDNVKMAGNLAIGVTAGPIIIKEKENT